MTASTIEAFSISHAAILDGESAAFTSTGQRRSDISKPYPVSAAISVGGDSILITFSEDLVTTSVPGISAFTTSNPAAAGSITAPSVTGKVLTLDSGSSTFTAATTVSYNPPSTNALQDAAGNKVEAWSATAVSAFASAFSSTTTEVDMYGVKEATLEADIGEFDNEGDDQVLSVWYWLNYANISVTQGYVPFDMISRITGDPKRTVGSGSSAATEIDLWTQSSLNQPTLPMLLKLPAKDETSATKNFYVVLYKVQFKPLSFDGPSYKEGLMLNYEGKALVSDKDEAGNSLTGDTRAVGRMVVTN